MRFYNQLWKSFDCCLQKANWQPKTALTSVMCFRQDFSCLKHVTYENQYSTIWEEKHASWKKILKATHFLDNYLCSFRSFLARGTEHMLVRPARKCYVTKNGQGFYEYMEKFADLSVPSNRKFQCQVNSLKRVHNFRVSSSYRFELF